MRAPSRLDYRQLKSSVVEVSPLEVSAAGIFPTKRPESPLCWWILSPLRVDTSNLSIDGSHPHFRTQPSLQVLLMGLTSLWDNIVGLPKHSKPTKPYQRYRLNSRKVLSSRYYPNLNHFYSNNVVFASACMYYSSLINMNCVYLTYNCTRQIVYIRGFSYLDYSDDY